MDARNESVFRAAAALAVRDPERAAVFRKAAAMMEDDGIGHDASRTIFKVTRRVAEKVSP